MPNTIVYIYELILTLLTKSEGKQFTGFSGNTMYWFHFINPNCSLQKTTYTVQWYCKEKLRIAYNKLVHHLQKVLRDSIMR
jgi:hypothetical protein